MWIEVKGNWIEIGYSDRKDKQLINIDTIKKVVVTSHCHHNYEVWLIDNTESKTIISQGLDFEQSNVIYQKIVTRLAQNEITKRRDKAALQMAKVQRSKNMMRTLQQIRVILANPMMADRIG